MRYTSREQVRTRIKELKIQLRAIIYELRQLGGDIVPDFNDVWGGAGPDCLPYWEGG